MINKDKEFKKELLFYLGVIVMVVVFFIIYIKTHTFSGKDVSEHIEIYQVVKVGEELNEYSTLLDETEDRKYVDTYQRRSGLYRYDNIFMYKETIYENQYVLGDLTVFNVEEELTKLQSNNSQNKYFISIQLSTNNKKIVGKIPNEYVYEYINNRKSGKEIDKVKFISQTIDESFIKWNDNK